MKKIVLPCCWATERRTENERPSRMFSTWYSIGSLGSPGADEVAVQRVHEPVRVDRAPGGDQRLRGDLPAEDALRRRAAGSARGSVISSTCSRSSSSTR